MTEIWKKLPAFEGYLVSNKGKVKSIDRAIVTKAGPTQTFRGRYLVLRDNKTHPHLFFEVSKTVNEKKYRKTFYIHKIVAELFLPVPSPKHIYVTHLDNDYSNNCVSNLKWITHKELMALQPQRQANPSKAWQTRKTKYGKTGSLKAA